MKYKIPEIVKLSSKPEIIELIEKTIEATSEDLEKAVEKIKKIPSKIMQDFEIFSMLQRTEESLSVVIIMIMLAAHFGEQRVAEQMKILEISKMLVR